MKITNINTRRVRAWMVLQDVTQQDVASRVGVTPQMVSLFILGRRRSAKLTQFYVEQGCPERYLDPGQVKQQKARKTTSG